MKFRSKRSTQNEEGGLKTNRFILHFALSILHFINRCATKGPREPTGSPERPSKCMHSGHSLRRHE
jgi:hypothetical protein